MVFMVFYLLWIYAGDICENLVLYTKSKGKRIFHGGNPFFSLNKSKLCRREMNWFPIQFLG
jgi:hypothetical protein